MKSTLLMDEKDIEENILIIEKQIQILNNIFHIRFTNIESY